MTDPNDLKRVTTFFQNPAPGAYPNVGALIAGRQPFVALYMDEKNGVEGVIHTSKIKDFAHFG